MLVWFDVPWCWFGLCCLWARCFCVCRFGWLHLVGFLGFLWVFWLPGLSDFCDFVGV